jgi:di/tricarboxylate transporter
LAVRRQAVPFGPGARRAVVVLVALIAVLATGAMPAFVASLLAACALVVLRVVSIEQAYRAISWTTVILVGAMFAVSRRSLTAEQRRRSGTSWLTWSAARDRTCC